MAINPGPGKPTTIIKVRERIQRRAPRTEGTYTNLSNAKTALQDAISRQNQMKTIPKQPSTQRNGGTQGYRMNKGRQGPI